MKTGLKEQVTSSKLADAEKGLGVEEACGKAWEP